MMKWCLDCPVPWTQFFFSVKWGEDLSLEQKGTLASLGTKQTTLRSVTSSQTSSAANDAAQMRKPSMEPLCERGLHLSASVGSWNMLKSWKIYGPRSERAEAGRNVYSVWSAGSCGFVTEQGKPLGSKDLMQLGHCQHFLDKPRFFVVEFRCARRNATQNALGERGKPWKKHLRWQSHRALASDVQDFGTNNLQSAAKRIRKIYDHGPWDVNGLQYTKYVACRCFNVLAATYPTYSALKPWDGIGTSHPDDCTPTVVNPSISCRSRSSDSSDSSIL